MRINNNTAAANASRNVSNTNAEISKNVERLSTGYRINKAGDDAAGLVISNRLRAQVSGLRQAIRNAQDGVSVLQVAEGALSEVSNMLNRMRDLAVQSANISTNDAAARAASQAEVNALLAEITRIGTTTKFGDVALFDGGFAPPNDGLMFQVGASQNETIEIDIPALTTVLLGIDGVDLTGNAAAINTAIGDIDDAIATVSSSRGSFGAFQNRFESLIANLSVTTENLAASESRIRDTDMAAEMVEFTKNQVLQQAGTAMLAQANQIPQSILSLLRG
jgi:flagellin